jgi:hypothetical protein
MIKGGAMPGSVLRHSVVHDEPEQPAEVRHTQSPSVAPELLLCLRCGADRAVWIGEQLGCGRCGATWPA